MLSIKHIVIALHELNWCVVILNVIIFIKKREKRRKIQAFCSYCFLLNWSVQHINKYIYIVAHDYIHAAPKNWRSKLNKNKNETSFCTPKIIMMGRFVLVLLSLSWSEIRWRKIKRIFKELSHKTIAIYLHLYVLSSIFEIPIEPILSDLTSDYYNKATIQPLTSFFRFWFFGFAAI